MFIIRESCQVAGVRFVQLVGKPTDEELETYLAEERKRDRARRGQPAVVVLSITEVWSSTQRRRMRDFELELEKEVRIPDLGMAMVVQNALIRGAFTAYFWLAAPKYPTKMVKSAADSYDFVAELLEAANQPVPRKDDFVREATREWDGRVAMPGQGLLPLQAA